MNRVTRRSRQQQYRRRCVIIGVILAFVALACLGKLSYIQLFAAQNIAQAATDLRTVSVPLNAQRGRILDTNGTILAQSVERYNIIGNPEEAQKFEPIDCDADTQDYCHQIDGKPLGVTGAAAVARLLATVLSDSNAMEIGGKLSGSGQYVVLAKDVTPAVKRKIDALHLSGIIYGELSNERIYSNGTLMGALLGGVNDKGTGVAGLEMMEDDVLTGTDGYEVYQQGSTGEEIPGTMTESQAAVNGSDVTLTIDQYVQGYCEKVLRDATEKYSSPWAIAVVEEVGTGNILALASSDEVEAGSDDAKMGTSRAVSETFEPGSIGKVFTMSAMLQTGLHKLSDQFTVTDSITVDGQTFKDATTHGTQHWTLAGILEQSSNVGMIMAGENLTNDQRYEFISKFGIGHGSGLNLPGEYAGSLTSPDVWDLRTQNTVLFGQGYSTNALEISNAIAAIANKGVKVQPKIIKSVTDADGHTDETPAGETTRILDEDVANQMMNAMESVAEHYQDFAGISGYRIAAKSGTAEVVGGDGRLSSIISDYSAIIPADNPKYVVTVVLKDPQGSYGGLTAGPVFAEIGEFLMQKYEVPTSTARTDAIPVTW